jgi:hypothetical protein
MEGNTIQVINLLIVIVPILSLVLGRIYCPNNFWVAMVFSALLFPIGHLYIKKGIGYVFIVLLSCYLMSLVVNNQIILFSVCSLISALLMFFRFKLIGIKKIEQGS